MTTDAYYGKKQGTTYLEIYNQPDDGGKPVIHRQLRDQEAYDNWHLAHYFNEILSYKRMLSADNINFEELPRKEKNLLLYLIIASQPQFNRVLEIGSTLFEMIEGFQLVEKYLEISKSSIPSVELRSLSYLGVEISDLFSFASEALHPEHSLTIYNHASNVHEHCDVLYDRTVTNYAFQTSREVADFINLSSAALLNFYVSKGETFISSRMGKSLTYFSLEEIISYVDKPLYHLFGEKAPGPFSGPETSMGKPVIEGFFLCSQPAVANKFMEMSQRDPTVKAYFEEKQIVLKEARTLLH